MRVNGLHGPSSTVATACAAGTDAIGLAAMLIRAGRADVMLAGGAEAPISPLVVAGYRRMRALASAQRPPAELSRPFDRARDGFVIAEGAGVVVLEERDHALARGARILCELVGYGSSSDAGHITDPDETGEGPARAVRVALAEAGVDAAEAIERVSGADTPNGRAIAYDSPNCSALQTGRHEENTSPCYPLAGRSHAHDLADIA